MTAKTKTQTTAAPAAEANGHSLPTDVGLTVPQRRILQVLADAAGPLTAKDLAAAAKVADSWLIGFTMRACAANRTLSLVEQGFATAKDQKVEEGLTERVFSVTPAGRKELIRLAKEEAAAAAAAAKEEAAREQAKADKVAAKEARETEKAEKAAAREAAKLERAAQAKAREVAKAAAAKAKADAAKAKASAEKAAAKAGK